MMNIPIRVFAVIQAILFLFIALGFTILMLGSAHKFNVRDLSQLKLGVELFVFYATTYQLLFKWSTPLKFNWPIFFLLLACQYSIVDIFQEIYPNEYDENEGQSIFIFLFFGGLFVNNIQLIYHQVIARNKSSRA